MTKSVKIGPDMPGLEVSRADSPSPVAQEPVSPVAKPTGPREYKVVVNGHRLKVRDN